jgi:hypothetical protein
MVPSIPPRHHRRLSHPHGQVHHEDDFHPYKNNPRPKREQSALHGSNLDPRQKENDRHAHDYRKKRRRQGYD